MIKKQDQLSSIAFHILLALGLKPRHGYEIMKQVEEDTRGHIKIGPGSLYGTINLLLENQFVQEHLQNDNKRRKYYELTKKGWDVLNNELEYMQHTFKIGQQRIRPSEQLTASILL